MKKIIEFMALVAVVLAMTSCKDKIQTTKGLVKRMSDTTIVATIDKYNIVFDTKKAKCDNGAVMPGDSVTIHYVGDLRDKRAKALLIRLMPKKGTVVEAVYDPSKELVVSEEPLSEKDKASLEKYAKSGKK